MDREIAVWEPPREGPHGNPTCAAGPRGVCKRWPARQPRRDVVGPALQVRYATDLTDVEYVGRRAWNDATAPECPWCRPGKCAVAPHGFYPRVKQQGAQVRRYLCRREGRTVSLLPDCLAAHLKGSLEELEAAVRAAEGAETRAEAADAGSPEGPASVLRWLGRREGWVRALPVTVKGLIPERFTGVEPTLAGFGQQLDSDAVLRQLREVAATHLSVLPAPVGFRPAAGGRTGVGKPGLGEKTQPTGLSPPARGTPYPFVKGKRRVFWLAQGIQHGGWPRPMTRRGRKGNWSAESAAGGGQPHMR